MAWASRLGRARISAKTPQAAGVCDRCGFVWTHSTLRWQNEWRGASLMNTRAMVCRRCEDTPQNQLRTIILPVDPAPIMNARVNNWEEAATDVHTAATPVTRDPRTGLPVPGHTHIQTMDGKDRLTQPTGPAGVPQYSPAGRLSSNGLEQWAIMPMAPGAVAYGRQLPVLSVRSDGLVTMTVTCSSPHRLKTDDQVSLIGLTDSEACGFYSVIVTTATTFTYMTNTPRPAGSLL